MLADHVSHFDAIQGRCRRLKGFEAFHGAGHLLDKPVILLNHVVEVFNLQGLDQPEPSMQQQQPVDVLQSCQVRTTLVDDDLFGPTIVLDRAGEEGAGRSLITVLRQHEIKGFSEFIDSAVEIGPLAFDLDIGLVHSPGTTGRGVATLGLSGNKRRIFHDPSVQRRMVNGNAALSHNLLQITIGDCISDVEKHCI